MGWIGIWHPGGGPQYAPLSREQGRKDALLTRGTIVLETRLSASLRPEPILLFEQSGSWPVRLTLQSVPGCGVTLVLEQSGRVSHCTLNASSAGYSAVHNGGDVDLVRLSLSWDAPRRWGRLALERPGDGKAEYVLLADLQPWRCADLEALLAAGPARYTAPGVVYMAASDRIEPLGPMPGLAAETPILTPGGYQPLSALRRGDLVVSDEGETLPVLHSVFRSAPAFGSFGPVRLRAPYFGLQQDIRVAQFLRLKISGSEVEYMFGKEAVLVPARHLVGTRTARNCHGGNAFVTYGQLILPGQAAPMAAGAAVESLHIGRLRRDAPRLAASLLAAAHRDSLPEHGPGRYPVLRAFDATVLAERRVA